MRRSGWLSRIIRSPARASAWSSTMIEVDGHDGFDRERKDRFDAEAATRHRSGLHPAVVQLHALAHPDQAVPEARLRPGGPRARAPDRPPSSLHLDAQAIGLVARGGPGRHERRRVLAHVRQRLLDEPVDRQLQPGRQLHHGARDLQVHREAGGASLVDQRGQALEARQRLPILRSSSTRRMPTRWRISASVCRPVSSTLLERRCEPDPGRCRARSARRRPGGR